MIKGNIFMKKIICLVLVFTMMLTACSKWNVEIVDPTKPIENNEELSSEAENIPDTSGDDYEEGPMEVYYGKQIVAVEFITKNDLNNLWVTKLEERGISVKITDIKFRNDENWKAKMVFEKGGKKFSVDFEGVTIYSDDNDYCWNYFGKAIIVDETTAVFCGKGKAVFFNTETLEPLEFVPEIPDLGTYSVWINAAGFDQEEQQYFLLATGISRPEPKEKTASICYYDESGKIVLQKETNFRGTSEALVEHLPYIRGDVEIFSLNGEKVIGSGYEFVEIESGKALRLDQFITFESGNYRLEINNCYPADEDYDPESYAALLYENGKFIESMTFTEPNLSTYYEETGKQEIKVSSNRKKATYYSDYFAMTLELDFEDKTHSVRYEPEDRHISEDERTIESSDGKYSICSFGNMGGGDVWYSHISVRNNETRKHSYIGKNGGMYGGSGGYGFLKNNDVYLYSAQVQ